MKTTTMRLFVSKYLSKSCLKLRSVIADSRHRLPRQEEEEEKEEEEEEKE